MITPRIDPRLASLDYIARRIGVSPAALRKLADAGKLPHIRVGKDYLVDADTAQATLLELARQGKGGVR